MVAFFFLRLIRSPLSFLFVFFKWFRYIRYLFHLPLLYGLVVKKNCWICTKIYWSAGKTENLVWIQLVVLLLGGSWNFQPEICTQIFFQYSPQAQINTISLYVSMHFETDQGPNRTHELTGHFGQFLLLYRLSRLIFLRWVTWMPKLTTQKMLQVLIYSSKGNH